MGYNKDMINDDTTRNIDFIPTDNRDEVFGAVRQWFKDNAFMALSEGAARDLEDERFSYLSLDLGGYVPTRGDNRRVTREPVQTSVYVTSDSFEDVRFIDPEGSEWRRHVFTAKASWSSSSSSETWLSRQRASLIDATVTLAEIFNAAFAERFIWGRVSTKHEREATQKKHMADTTRLVVARQIQSAIHTTCRGMRVDNERTIPFEASESTLAGTYEVALENKEYRAEVFQLIRNSEWRLSFRRTK